MQFLVQLEKMFAFKDNEYLILVWMNMDGRPFPSYIRYIQKYLRIPAVSFADTLRIHRISITDLRSLHRTCFDLVYDEALFSYRPFPDSIFARLRIQNTLTPTSGEIFFFA